MESFLKNHLKKNVPGTDRHKRLDQGPLSPALWMKETCSKVHCCDISDQGTGVSLWRFQREKEKESAG